MYPNLNAELARHKMTVMMLSEKIRDVIDDGLTLDYLFSEQALEVVE